MSEDTCTLSDPLTISWSRLKAYETCKQSVLRSMQGRSSKATDGRNFLPGTVADRCMREWLEEGDCKPGGMLELIDKHFEEHTSADAEYVIKWRGNVAADKKKARDQVVECLTNLEPHLMKRVVPFRYQPELRFRTTIAIPDLNGKPTPITLIGGIDIAVQDDSDNFELMDLKNTRNDNYVKGTLGQLVFYSIAWGAYLGIKEQPTRASFLTPLCKEQYVPVDITLDAKRQMLSRIIKYAHGVWRQEWEPTLEDSPCWGCAVKHACSRYSLPPVRDAQGKNRVNFQALAQKRRDIRAAKEVSTDEQ